jgi:hypothetical protein
MRAWYSKEQEHLVGSSLYRTPDGGTVCVTEVTDDADVECGFADAAVVGPVIHFKDGGFIRTVKKGCFKVNQL